MVTVVPGQKVLSSHINAKLDKDNSDNKPTANFAPASNNAYDLGTASLRWKDLYLSGSSIYLGGLKITNNAGTLEWDGNAIIDGTGKVDATTLQTYSVGTGANNIVKLDGSSKLPAVDGSQLTNLPAPSGSQLAEVKMFCLSITGAVTKATLQADGWAVCDGTTPSSQGIVGATITTTPNLEHKFIRMSNDETSGNIGGADTHSHGLTGSGANILNAVASGSNRLRSPTNSASSLPSYYEMVLFIKVKV